jgi:hypothetical protein
MFLGAPTISWAFLLVSVVGAVFTANAFVPVRRVPALFMPSFFGSWLTAELAIHHVFWQAIATVVLMKLGALDAWPGWAGLFLTFGLSSEFGVDLPTGPSIILLAAAVYAVSAGARALRGRLHGS